MASVPITVLLYDGLLLCGFNVAIKRLIMSSLLLTVGAAVASCPFQTVVISVTVTRVFLICGLWCVSTV